MTVTTNPIPHPYLSACLQNEPHLGDAPLNRFGAATLQIAQSLELPLVLEQVAQQVAALFAGTTATSPLPSEPHSPPVDLVRLARLLANFYQQTTSGHQKRRR